MITASLVSFMRVKGYTLNRHHTKIAGEWYAPETIFYNEKAGTYKTVGLAEIIMLEESFIA